MSDNCTKNFFQSYLTKGSIPHKTCSELSIDKNIMNVMYVYQKCLKMLKPENDTFSHKCTTINNKHQLYQNICHNDCTVKVPLKCVSAGV